MLKTIKPNSVVIIDGSENEFIDEDTLEMIQEYINESGKLGIDVSTEELDLSKILSTGLH